MAASRLTAIGQAGTN